jgi:hypothetical protein
MPAPTFALLPDAVPCAYSNAFRIYRGERMSKRGIIIILPISSFRLT